MPYKIKILMIILMISQDGENFGNSLIISLKSHYLKH